MYVSEHNSGVRICLIDNRQKIWHLSEFLTFIKIDIAIRQQLQQDIKLNLIGQCGFEQDKIFTWSCALSQISGLCEITTYLTWQVKIGSVKAGYHAWTKILQMFNIIFFKRCWCLFPHFTSKKQFGARQNRHRSRRGAHESLNYSVHSFCKDFLHHHHEM